MGMDLGGHNVTLEWLSYRGQLSRCVLLCEGQSVRSEKGLQSVHTCVAFVKCEGQLTTAPCSCSWMTVHSCDCLGDPLHQATWLQPPL